jgi:transcription initiation factor IIF auxiliary subunit
VIVALSIQQDASYLGNDRWAWSLQLNGTPAELDDVDHVVYVLHPTFHNPVRVIRDRASNFRIKTSGWGTFTVYVNIIHRDGREESHEHNLVLVYPDGTPTPA